MANRQIIRGPADACGSCGFGAVMAYGSIVKTTNLLNITPKLQYAIAPKLFIIETQFPD